MLLKLCILLVAVVGLVYLGAVGFAYLYADGMIFPNIPSSYETLSHLQKIQSRDGESIAVLYLESPNKEHLILYSHGNGEDLGTIFPILQLYQKRGISVLAYDYPGYGQSSGQASEAGVFAAAQATYDFALKELGYRPEQITLYGRSLGSGPSSWLAAQHPVHGVILEGAFSSTFRVMTHVKVLPFDTFDNLPRLRASQCPVLVLHGERDHTVPFKHAAALLAAVGERGQHLWLPDAGHNDIIQVAGDQYWDTVLPFIQRASISP